MRIGFLTDNMGYKLLDSKSATHLKIYTIEDGALQEEVVEKIGESGSIEVLIGTSIDESIRKRVVADIYLESPAEWVIKALEGYVMGTINMKKYGR